MAKTKPSMGQFTKPSGTSERDVRDMTVTELERLRKGLKDLRQDIKNSILLAGEGIDKRQ